MFHIIFSADENYVPYTAVLMTSIVKNTDSKKTFKDFCNTEVIHKIFSDFGKYNFSALGASSDTNEGYVFHILSNSIGKQTREKT